MYVSTPRQARRRSQFVTVDGTIRFVISDNGQGFDMEAQRRRQAERGSLGLLSMSERAKQIGGIVQIMSMPGSGTAVTIVVPFRA